MGVLLVDLNVRATQAAQETADLVLDLRPVALKGAAEFGEAIHQVFVDGVMPREVGVADLTHQQLFVTEMMQREAGHLIEALAQMRKSLQLIQRLIVGLRRRIQAPVLLVHDGVSDRQAGGPY